MNRRDFLRSSLATGAAVTILTPDLAAKIIVPPESGLLQPIITDAKDVYLKDGVLDLTGHLTDFHVSIENNLRAFPEIGTDTWRAPQLGMQTMEIAIGAFLPPESFPVLTGEKYLINLGPKYGYASVIPNSVETTASVGEYSRLRIQGVVLPRESNLIGFKL